MQSSDISHYFYCFDYYGPHKEGCDGGVPTRAREPTRGNKSEVWYENPNLNKLNIYYFKYGTQRYTYTPQKAWYYNNTYLIYVPISFVGPNVIKTVYFWIFWLELEIMTKVYLYWPLCILSMNYWNISSIKCTLLHHLKLVLGSWLCTSFFSQYMRSRPCQVQTERCGKQNFRF